MFIEEPILCENMEAFPEIAAACLNVDATSYNAVIQEQRTGIHYNVGKSELDYVKNQEDFIFTDGFVALPQMAGLGIDVNKELVVEENKNPNNWKKPFGIMKTALLRSGSQPLRNAATCSTAIPYSFYSTKPPDNRRLWLFREKNQWSSKDQNLSKR